MCIRDRFNSNPGTIQFSGFGLTKSLVDGSFAGTTDAARTENASMTTKLENDKLVISGHHEAVSYTHLTVEPSLQPNTPTQPSAMKAEAASFERAASPSQDWDCLLYTSHVLPAAFAAFAGFFTHIIGVEIQTIEAGIERDPLFFRRTFNFKLAQLVIPQLLCGSLDSVKISAQLLFKV